MPSRRRAADQGLARYADQFAGKFPQGPTIGGLLDRDLLAIRQKTADALPNPHAETHVPGGDDELPTGVPVDVDVENLEGSALDFARSDHQHRLGIVTTKGDLIASDGADPVRLPVGADGLVLMADSNEDTGLLWAELPPAPLVLTKTADYTPLTDYEIILVDATAAAVYITLPAAVLGRRYTVKKIDASANQLWLVGSFANTIDGSLDWTTAVQYLAITVVCDGTSWWILSKFI